MRQNVGEDFDAVATGTPRRAEVPAQRVGARFPSLPDGVQIDTAARTNDEAAASAACWITRKSWSEPQVVEPTGREPTTPCLR
jgi:hypothetical protein